MASQSQILIRKRKSPLSPKKPSLISHTHKHAQEWSTEIRSYVIAWSHVGISQRTIGAMFKPAMSRSTVQTIIRRFKNTRVVDSALRTGRPLKLDDRDLRKLERLTTKNAESRRANIKDIQEDFDMDVSTQTICHTFKKLGINSHPATIKSYISIENAKKRVQCCKERLNYTSDDWMHTI